jgi:hypothetical protein
VLFGRHAARVEVRGGVSRSVDPSADKTSSPALAPGVPTSAAAPRVPSPAAAGPVQSPATAGPVPSPAVARVRGDSLAEPARSPVDRDELVGGRGARPATSAELAPAEEPTAAIAAGHAGFAAPVRSGEASPGPTGGRDVAPGAPQAGSPDRAHRVGGGDSEAAPEESTVARRGRRQEDPEARGGAARGDGARGSAARGTGDLSGRSPASDEPATRVGSQDADPTAVAAYAKQRPSRAGPTNPTNPAPVHAPSLGPLYRQCESAAQRGDCAVVKRLVEKITPADRGYRGRLAKGSAVARCLAE